jgi:hypothetical protein
MKSLRGYLYVTFIALMAAVAVGLFGRAAVAVYRGELFPIGLLAINMILIAVVDTIIAIGKKRQ